MKNLFLLSFFAFLFANTNAQVSILTARGMSAGSTVTVNGVVLNGSELGTQRYLYDHTAGICIYSTSLSGVNRGDSIIVTGTISIYMGLVEISPVSSYSVISTAHPLPNPAILTPSQLTSAYESQLVGIVGATFMLGGSTFAGNTTYNFTSSSQTGVAFIRTGHPLIGAVIPTLCDTLFGINSVYTTYQLLPRDINDLVVNHIQITTPITPSNLTTTSFDLNWTTNITGSTFIKYGMTQNLELGYLNGVGGSTAHMISVAGLSAGSIYFARAFSVNGTDTAMSIITPFATVSNSTGDIKVYFDLNVDTSVSTGTYAIQNLAIADTMIGYINRANHSLDVAEYSFTQTNLPDIAGAINAAYTRGVKVRFIADGSLANSGLSLLNAAIPVVLSPQGANYSIMHNKFIIIDAFSTNPNESIVWTGSTNWTDNQMMMDANNVIIFQDQSIAKGYTLEFNEMWGDTGIVPNASLQKFGQYKTNNTPHEYLINGKRVESYFSPSDNTNQHILDAINSANTSLYFSVLSFTRTDLAYAISNKTTSGVQTGGMVDDTSSSGYVYVIMKNVMNGNLLIYNQPGLLHHKYLIADWDNTSSDPLVLTGSHNWSNTANQKNDENTVIVHDATIANIYFQEWIKRYTLCGGVLGTTSYWQTTKDELVLFPNPATTSLIVSQGEAQGAGETIRIYDFAGRILQCYNLTGQMMSIDISSLPHGIYFLQSGTQVAKFVKE